VAFQQVLRGFADQWHRQIQTLAVDAEKVFGQRQDVADPFAQRRQFQLPFAEVVIKPFVKFPRVHRLCQIDAGGRYQPYIHRAWLMGADAGDFMIFQGGEQFDLDR